MIRNPRFLDTKGACRLLNVSRETLRLWEKRGKLFVRKVEGKNIYSYSKLANLKKSKAGRHKKSEKKT